MHIYWILLLQSGGAVPAVSPEVNVLISPQRQPQNVEMKIKAEPQTMTSYDISIPIVSTK